MDCGILIRVNLSRLGNSPDGREIRGGEGILLKLHGIIPHAAAALVVFAGSSSSAILKGPYLVGVTETGIRVRWETDAGADSRVDYGTTDSYGAHVAGDYSTYLADSGTYLHDVPLSGLAADTIYHYSVTTSGSSSGDRTFRTAPEQCACHFRFVVYGDNRGKSETDTDMSVQERITDAVLSFAPSFVVNTGDSIFAGENYANWGTQLFAPAAGLMGRIPYYLVYGNHEVPWGAGAFDWAAAFMYYPRGPGERWYSFDYGNAHFAVVDSNVDYSPGSAQHAWLEDDLENADSRWLVVSFHHPPYTARSDEHYYDPWKKKAQDYLVPLMERYGVDMVFNGHVHWYERSRKNDVTYVTAAGGGAPLEEWGPDAPNPYQRFLKTCYHFCTVDVCGDRVYLTARDIDGAPFDACVITPTPKLNLAVTPDSASAGDRVTVTARIEALSDTFDAWVVVVGPDGGVFSITRYGGLKQGAEPLARSVRGLGSDREVTLLEATIPSWLATGAYTIAAALLPPGTVPTSLDGAERGVLEGYFDREHFTVD